MFHLFLIDTVDKKVAALQQKALKAYYKEFDLEYVKPIVHPDHGNGHSYLFAPKAPKAKRARATK